VIFPHIEENLSAVVGSQIVNAPIMQGVRSNSNNRGNTRCVATENSKALRDSEAFEKTEFLVAAGANNQWNNLATESTRFQFYKFRRLEFIWTPGQGATTAGKIAIASVASPDDADNVNSWDDIVALPSCYSGSLWTGFRHTIDPSTLNLQMPAYSCKYPVNYVDGTDPTQCQGYIVVAVQGTAATHTLDVGSFAISYVCDFMNVKTSVVAGGVEHWHNAAGQSLALTNSVLGSKNELGFKIVTNDPTTTTPDYVVTYPGKSPALVIIAGADSGSLVNANPAIATTTNCTAVNIYSAFPVAGTGCIGAWVVKPTVVNSTVVFTLTLSVSGGTYDSVRLICKEIHGGLGL